MRKLKLYLLSILLFSLAGGLILILVEMGLRWSSSRTGEHRDHVVETPYLPVKLKPNYQGTFWGIPFSTNRYGFRDDSEIFGSGEYRILSLGDSIGFGLGIDARDHYTQVLERKLNDGLETPYFQVINAGGQGYSPSGYYAYLVNEGLELKPSMVLLEIELCNDITDEALLRWAEPGAVVGGRYVVSWDGKLLGTYSRGSYFFEKTYTYTVLIRRLFNLLNRFHPTEPLNSVPGARVYYTLGFDQFLLSQDRIDSGWQRMFASLADIHQELLALNIDFLLMLMPSRYIYEDRGAYTAFATGLMERAARMSREAGIPFIEMTPGLKARGGESLFFDFAHLTSEGNEAVAEYLYGKHFSKALPFPSNQDESLPQEESDP